MTELGDLGKSLFLLKFSSFSSMNTPTSGLYIPLDNIPTP